MLKERVVPERKTTSDNGYYVKYGHASFVMSCGSQRQAMPVRSLLVPRGSRSPLRRGRAAFREPFRCARRGKVRATVGQRGSRRAQKRAFLHDARRLLDALPASKNPGGQVAD